MKKIILSIAFIEIIFSFVVANICTNNYLNEKDDKKIDIINSQKEDEEKWFEGKKIYLTIFPSSGCDCGYVFELLNNGMLKAYYGDSEELSEEIDINKNNFGLIIEEKKDKKIGDKELQILDKMLPEIIKNGESKENMGVLDTWSYVLWIDYKKYYRALGDKEDRDEVMKFINILLDLSPINLDLYGFS